MKRTFIMLAVSSSLLAAMNNNASPKWRTYGTLLQFLLLNGPVFADGPYNVKLTQFVQISRATYHTAAADVT